MNDPFCGDRSRVSSVYLVREKIKKNNIYILDTHHVLIGYLLMFDQ